MTSSLAANASRDRNAATKITSSFSKIAKGDIPGAVKTIENVLKNGLSLSLGFLASAADLTKIASSIKATLNKIQKPAQEVLTKIDAWIKKMFSSLENGILFWIRLRCYCNSCYGQSAK
jgi:hypothetical protein